MVLTDTVIKQARPKNKPYSIKDLDGLFLFVAINGTKNWHFRYLFNGKAVRTYPEISLKEVRILRDEARSHIARGIEPRKQRAVNHTQASNTHHPDGVLFCQFADYWKTFKLKKLRLHHSQQTVIERQSTQVQIERYLRKDILKA